MSARSFWLIALLALLLTLPVATQAQKTLVIVVDHMTVDDLFNPKLPQLHRFAEKSYIGLMTTAVAGPRTDLAANLALATGRIIPAEESDAWFYSADHKIGHTTAGEEFSRRTGSTIQNNSVAPGVHLGMASLLRRNISLPRENKSAFIRSGANSPLPSSALLAMGNTGVIPLTSIDINEIDPIFSSNDDPDILVAQYSHDQLASLEPFWQSRVDNESKQNQGDRCRCILVSPLSSEAAAHKQPRLTPIVINESHGGSGIITSPTTRTMGLIANVDLKPTLMSWSTHRTFRNLFSGRPMSNVQVGNSLITVLKMDRVVTANDAAGMPLFIFLGIICSIAVFSGLALLRFRPEKVSMLRPVFLWLFTMPGAMLAVAPLEMETPASIFASVLLAMFVIAETAHFLTRKSKSILSPLILITWFTVGIVCIDGYFGSPFLRFSVLEAYQLLGIRYYGIGNEYMGMMIGLAIFAALATKASETVKLVSLGLIALVIGLPSMGANAGGLISAAAGFGSVVPIMLGKKWKWRYPIISTIVGVVFTFQIAAIDAGSANSTHMGQALTKANSSGFQYLFDIAARKVAMNYHIASSPGVLTAIAGLLLAGLFMKKFMSTHWQRIIQDNPNWATSLCPSIAGAIVAFLFNDSGIVAAIYLLAAPAAVAAFLLCSAAKSVSNKIEIS